jgi:5-methylcytosine-specific restriction endonuclease McrA
VHKKGRVGYKTIVADPTIAQSRYISKELRKSILERDGNKCVRCGSIHALDIDHALPISLGGKSSEDNLQVLCRECNGQKGARTWWGPTLIDKILENKTLEYIQALYRQQRFK